MMPSGGHSHQTAFIFLLIFPSENFLPASTLPWSSPSAHLGIFCWQGDFHEFQIPGGT